MVWGNDPAAAGHQAGGHGAGVPAPDRGRQGNFAGNGHVVLERAPLGVWGNPILPKEGARRVGTSERPGLELRHPPLTPVARAGMVPSVESVTSAMVVRLGWK
jgi:hypothetical protein